MSHYPLSIFEIFIFYSPHIQNLMSSHFSFLFLRDNWLPHTQHSHWVRMKEINDEKSEISVESISRNFSSELNRGKPQPKCQMVAYWNREHLAWHLKMKNEIHHCDELKCCEKVFRIFSQFHSTRFVWEKKRV